MRAFLSWMMLYGIGLVLGGALLLWRAIVESRRAPGGRHRRRAVDARHGASDTRAEANAQREADAVPIGIVDAPDLSEWPEPEFADAAWAELGWAEGRVRGQATVYSTTADEAFELGAAGTALGRITQPALGKPG